jgi:NAD(P)-dependent dehydrogenase (short-subunit alcohol dehydrogenase family)
MMVKPLGIVRTCRAAIPFLKKSPCGRIINISGVHGKEPTNYSAMAAVANAGTLGFTKALLTKWAHLG